MLPTTDYPFPRRKRLCALHRRTYPTVTYRPRWSREGLGRVLQCGPSL